MQGHYYKVTVLRASKSITSKVYLTGTSIGANGVPAESIAVTFVCFGSTFVNI